MKLALGDCVIAEGSAESMRKFAKRLGEYGFKTKVALEQSPETPI
jgi:hypothetical protein